MSIFDLFRLDGKVAVVTGGNHGIGRAVCTAFAEAGASVTIVGRNQARNAEAVADLRALGAQAISIKADITQSAALQDVARQVTEQLGPPDILVNNAGIGLHARSVDVDDAHWRRVMATNLDAVWMASQIIGQGMLKRGTGTIVNIGSMSGLIVNRPQWHAPYAISKAAVHHLTRSLAAEWAPSGVRVNAVAPGYTNTGIADIHAPEFRHYWIDEMPMRRYAHVDEISPAVLYLASPASSFVTGEVMVVDGGYTLW